MKRTALLILPLVFLGFNPEGKQNGQPSGSNSEQAARAFSELRLACDRDNAKLWNHSLDGPVMLVDRNTRAILANEADGNGVLKKEGDLFAGILPASMNIANTATDWSGRRWTMVALPLPDDKAGRLDLLIHESFHRIQPFIGFDSLVELSNDHLDTRDGRLFLKLELEALKKALGSETPEPFIKDALAFREYRYQLFPDAKEAENSLEISEGLAEYTGSILSGRSVQEMKEHFTASIDTFYTRPTFVRSFAYYTTPVYGYFMRQGDPRWNLKISKTTNLTDFMLAFYQIAPATLSSDEIVSLGSRYQMNTIMTGENARELRRLAQVRKYKSRFLGDSALTIGLVHMSIGFNPGNLVPLDTFGTVYPNLRITDDWGVLEVDSCGALVSPMWNKVTVSYPRAVTDTVVTGNGWTVKLNSGWRLSRTGSRWVVVNK
jgi:hypothetical protein